MRLSDPPGQQRITRRGQPFDPVEGGPQLAGSRPGHRIRIQTLDHPGEQLAGPGHRVLEHTFDPNGPPLTPARPASTPGDNHPETALWTTAKLRTSLASAEVL